MFKELFKKKQKPVLLPQFSLAGPIVPATEAEQELSNGHVTYTGPVPNIPKVEEPKTKFKYYVNTQLVLKNGVEPSYSSNYEDLKEAKKKDL